MTTTLHVLKVSLVDNDAEGEPEWFVSLKGKISYELLVNARDAGRWRLRAVASGRRPAPGAFRGILVPVTPGATLDTGDSLEVVDDE